MRIDLHSINVALPDDLQRHAETRLWQVAGPWRDRVVWTGMWLTEHPDLPIPGAPTGTHLTCRVDAWVRGIGIITVRHEARAIAPAIDVATALLERAIAREMRHLPGQLETDDDLEPALRQG